jgi:hypothetical protein
MSGLQRSQSVAIDLDVRPLAGRIGAQIDNSPIQPFQCAPAAPRCWSSIQPVAADAPTSGTLT